MCPSPYLSIEDVHVHRHVTTETASRRSENSVTRGRSTDPSFDVNQIAHERVNPHVR